MATAANAVRVYGLQDLRRDLRALGPDAVREVQRAIKTGVEVIAQDARFRAPKLTGALASSIRATTSGHKGVVRSPLPYANVQHWGGTTGRGHAPGHAGAIRVRATLFITRAVENNEERLVEAIGDAIEEAAVRNGWH